MLIGVIKEIKSHEYRVGLTPSCAKAYVKNGHKVLFEKSCGLNAGFEDQSYIEAGASLANSAEEVYHRSEMVVKVKEPLKSEAEQLKENQILFTYLHLAANRELTEQLINNKVSAVAYETIEDNEGHLCCLKPMSEIAGRLSVQEGAKYLEKTFGGKGVLLGGVPGVQRGKVLILGAGVVGTNACKIAVGIGAEVTVIDINAQRMAYLDDIFGSRITTLYNTDRHLEQSIANADVIIGAVLIPGAAAPKLISTQQLSAMKAGTVLVDIAIDQGGCFESSKPTTHDNPIYIKNQIVHYCVTNMPGAVALSSTLALTSTTLPFGLNIANLGLKKACRQQAGLSKGLNVHGGACVYPSLAQSLGIPISKFNS